MSRRKWRGSLARWRVEDGVDIWSIEEEERLGEDHRRDGLLDEILERFDVSGHFYCSLTCGLPIRSVFRPSFLLHSLFSRLVSFTLGFQHLFAPLFLLISHVLHISPFFCISLFLLNSNFRWVHSFSFLSDLTRRDKSWSSHQLGSRC